VKILYAAIDQRVPGTVGGSTHVTAVAEGLSALGHEVHVLAAPGADAFPADGVQWHALEPPFGLRQLRCLRWRRVLDLVRRVRPDAVIERYYNFGGEGVLAARRAHAMAVLEVNAPVVDHPGSLKGRLDRALIGEPMRRWREWQCAAADLIVTPSRAILPGSVPADRILEIEWGADTTRFRPDAAGTPPFTRSAQELVVIFAGAFRRWHGAIQLVEAARRLRARGRGDVTLVFVGHGPALASVRQAAKGLPRVVFTGTLSHHQMPACLAAADIGAAPFDVAAHAPLRLGFYWSPLKVFEYMASALPVVAPDIDRLRRIVRPGVEGILYDPADPEGLAGAIDTLRDPALRGALGAAARERAVREFGWDLHCRRLSDALSVVSRQSSVDSRL